MATKYSDLKDAFYYIRHAGSSNTKSMVELFDFNGTGLVKQPFSNGVLFNYFEDNLGIPQNLKFFSPARGKVFGFRAQDLIQENFPTNSGEFGPYGIRIQGYVNGRYPSNLGTIYFSDWNTFYNFSKYIFLGE